MPLSEGVKASLQSLKGEWRKVQNPGFAGFLAEEAMTYCRIELNLASGIYCITGNEQDHWKARNQLTVKVIEILNHALGEAKLYQTWMGSGPGAVTDGATLERLEYDLEELDRNPPY